MVIQWGGKSNQVAVCYKQSSSNHRVTSNHPAIIELQAMWLEISDNHFTFKVTNNYLNVCEQVEMVEKNKNGSLPSLEKVSIKKYIFLQ